MLLFKRIVNFTGKIINSWNVKFSGYFWNVLAVIYQCFLHLHSSTFKCQCLCFLAPSSYYSHASTGQSRIKKQCTYVLIPDLNTGGAIQAGYEQDTGTKLFDNGLKTRFHDAIKANYWFICFKTFGRYNYTAFGAA